MGKKIVITGGIGYIGTELCKIYSGYSWNDQITVIDNRFISERVNQLRNWNINFIHGDILDKDLIKKHCHDADIIHHLAGITNVPRVKSESSQDHDKKIKIVAEEGTKNILDAMSINCKIVMPSTHVIYEGLNDVKRNIDEDEEACPVLSYGQSKFINEKQLKESGKKYVILRLGSVYGYSTDTTRLDIMANFFAKIASQNGVLRLFAGGKQIKSLVPLIDVARCFKFMEERDDIKSNTFNLSKDSVTVEEVANICKKINPKTKIIKTEDLIPNPGYSLSNKKLLNVGFKFLYGLEESIEERVYAIADSDRYTNGDYNYLVESSVSQVGKGAENPFTEGGSAAEMPHRGKSHFPCESSNIETDSIQKNCGSGYKIPCKGCTPVWSFLWKKMPWGLRRAIR